MVLQLQFQEVQQFMLVVEAVVEMQVELEELVEEGREVQARRRQLA